MKKSRFVLNVDFTFFSNLKIYYTFKVFKINIFGNLQRKKCEA